jgi:hypothetical protein
LFSASEILNSIAWTDKLDKKFRENFDNKSIKAWQYIGLSNGVYRFYPGTTISFVELYSLKTYIQFALVEGRRDDCVLSTKLKLVKQSALESEL